MSLPWFAMAAGLVGGLALFLIGLERLADDLQAGAGQRMKQVLARLTTNRMLGAVVGAGITAVVQSSSVTTVLAVGFASAGLLTAVQAVGVIMGANVGTTITGQIVAFEPAALGLPLIALGFAITTAARRAALRHLGGVLLGLGFVFYGLGLMSDAMRPLRTYEPFVALMAGVGWPPLAILVGAVATAIMQSSSAIIAITILLASSGLVTLEMGIALALGANVGTCATALLAGLRGGDEALRVAYVHVLFNLAGVLLWLPLIGVLAELARATSPSAPELEGIARLAADTPRQIAMANTLFNVIATVLFLPFAPLFVRAATRLAALRPTPATMSVEPKFLDESFVDTPAVALDAVRRELGHVAERVAGMMPALDRSGPAPDTGAEEAEVDSLHRSILAYLAGLRAEGLSPVDQAARQRLVEASAALELASNTIDGRLVPLLRKLAPSAERMTATTRARLETLYAAVNRSLADVAVAAKTPEAAAAVSSRTGEIRALGEEVVAGISRHMAGRPESDLGMLRTEMEIAGVLVGLQDMAAAAAAALQRDPVAA
ncbi:MAG: Na/Pi cotransporter family protein [Pseudomonadota bacterium]